MKNNKQPEIRFPGFTEDWEQRKLGELLGDNTIITVRVESKLGIAEQIDWK